METQEPFFTCPYCWKSISMVLDLSVEGQTFVEDCEVCCHPMEVTYEAADGELLRLEIKKIQ